MPLRVGASIPLVSADFQRAVEGPVLAASRLTAVARLLTFVQVAETCDSQDETRPRSGRLMFQEADIASSFFRAFVRL
jgi:hypothetical protein